MGIIFNSILVKLVIFLAVTEYAIMFALSFFTTLHAQMDQHPYLQAFVDTAVLALSCTLFYYWVFKRPLDRIIGTLAVIEAGDLSARADEKTGGELGAISTAINQMTVSLDRASRDLEKRVEERTFELSVLYEISNTISYTLDHDVLLKSIMESLLKVVKYDICASLLLGTQSANIIIRPACIGGSRFVTAVRERIADTVATLTGEDIRKRDMDVSVLPSPMMGATCGEGELCSFFTVPFVSQSKVVGLIHIASCKENAFSETDIKLVYTIANEASGAIEKLRGVIATERNKMDRMVASMTEGVIMIDECWKIVVFNPRAREILHFGRKEDVDIDGLKERLKTIRLENVLEDCWAAGYTIARETIIPHGEKNIVLHVDVLFVRSDHDAPAGLAMILRDVTAERGVENLKTDFVSIVSHELRTPLSILKEGLSLVRDGVVGPVNDQHEKFLSMADISIDRLTGIINNLLDISKLEAGKLIFRKERIDLADLVKTTVSSFEPKAREKGLVLKAVLPEDHMETYVDGSMLTEVFINLISNAIKFTEKGSVEVIVRDNKNVIECVVSDSGRGLSHEDLSKAFGKFQQFDRSSGGIGEEGTGLGLAITKGIIEGHNGKIWMDSEMDKGTTVTFTLPKYTAAEIFSGEINNRMIEAVRKHAKMSLVVVSMDPVLKDVDVVLKKAMRHGENIVAGDAGERLVLLSDCPKGNVEIVKKRLQQALEGISGKTNLRLGVATYPDDAENDADLLKKARANRNW